MDDTPPLIPGSATGNSDEEMLREFGGTYKVYLSEQALAHSPHAIRNTERALNDTT